MGTVCCAQEIKKVAAGFSLRKILVGANHDLPKKIEKLVGAQHAEPKKIKTVGAALAGAQMRFKNLSGHGGAVSLLFGGNS